MYRTATTYRPAAPSLTRRVSFAARLESKATGRGMRGRRSARLRQTRRF